MDKLTATILIMLLTLIIFIGVIQDGIAPSIIDKGVEVESIIETN